MARGVDRSFRMDNDVLAFCFTATVIDRAGQCIELLDSPDRLTQWWAEAELPHQKADEAWLRRAIELREAIFRAGCAVATREQPTRKDARLLNEVAAAGHAHLVLTGGVAQWHSPRASPADALAILASDAIAVLGDPANIGRVKRCEDLNCGGLYLDTSRGNNRRWCSMNFCGNRAKRANMRRRSAAEG